MGAVGSLAEGTKSDQTFCFLVRPEGLEPPAYWFEANRSIQSELRARFR
jgi:hypothetical protein